MNESADFSDEGLDAFEDSVDESNIKKKDAHVIANAPYDEAYEVSQDLSMAESFDGRDAKADRERKLRNDKYDEAYEVSQSMDHTGAGGFSPSQPRNDPRGGAPKSRGESKLQDEGKSQSIKLSDTHFDEALEISQSGSDESVDTVAKKEKSPPVRAGGLSAAAPSGSAAKTMDFSSAKPTMSSLQSAPAKDSAPSSHQPSISQSRSLEHHESGSEDGDHEESYENIEGAYNPKDFHYLSVSTEVKDLFQYIERYKPQEVELPTTLKCFIPEYIPTIGEMDAFIKIPRPDGKPDDLGLKFLDEPAASQSDPTVLELQLRAMTKKVQYGDVVVRSIEDAARNPAAIDRWIQSISDLHRTKPPPQVHYRRNMPDIDTLMDIWPEDFERALETMNLPSPDLDLSLLEYSKLLCALLDIPTYDNPIESVHLMFSLFVEFRNNPHFQSKQPDGEGKEADSAYGGADVMEINQSYK